MKRSQTFRLLGAILVVALCAGVAVLVATTTWTPENKIFEIQARRYAYDPPVISVNRGDTVHIRLSSLDVVHGFRLEGHDIDAKIYPLRRHIRLRASSKKNGYREVDEIVFIADKIGKFRYRCSQTCGYLHPFMQGEFVVGPNYPLHTAVGAAVGVFFAGSFLFFLRIRIRGKGTKELQKGRDD